MAVIYYILFGFHLIVCVFLVAVILLQAGKGGGLSDAFGGGAAQHIFGSRAGDFLSKATTATAILFMVTSLGLAMFSAYKSKSLTERGRLLKQIEEKYKQEADKAMQEAQQKAQQQKDTKQQTVEKAVETTKETAQTQADSLKDVQPK